MLLNVYGGPGTTNVWIDDLEVAGHVASARLQSPPADGPALCRRRQDAAASWTSNGIVRLPPVGPSQPSAPQTHA